MLNFKFNMLFPALSVISEFHHSLLNFKTLMPSWIYYFECGCGESAPI